MARHKILGFIFLLSYNLPLEDKQACVQIRIITLRPYSAIIPYDSAPPRPQPTMCCRVAMKGRTREGMLVLPLHRRL